MSGYLVNDERKVTTRRFIEMKEKGEKISMLTSYDYTTAGIVDRAGIDGILIGDSASNVMVGNSTTLPMTVDQMIYHARSVVNGVKRALVVCDMVQKYHKLGVKWAETNAELEENHSIRNHFEAFDRVQHKRRRAYKKEID